MKHYFYYVGIQTKSGMSFVTSVNNSTKSCVWDTDQKPLEMPYNTACNIAEGLCFNFNVAVVVKSSFEIENHFTAFAEITT